MYDIGSRRRYLHAYQLERTISIDALILFTVFLAGIAIGIITEKRGRR